MMNRYVSSRCDKADACTKVLTSLKEVQRRNRDILKRPYLLTLIAHLTTLFVTTSLVTIVLRMLTTQTTCHVLYVLRVSPTET